MLSQTRCVFVVAVVLCLFACASPPHETDEEMLRLEMRLGEPHRILSRELLELSEKEKVDIFDLQHAATEIVTTRARFGDLDKNLAVEAVKFAHVEGVPVERSTDLVTRAAYDLDWGEDAPKILSWGIDATEGTPNLRAADAIQVILDMAPYWKQAHQLTGRSVREISLDKAPTVFAIQKVLYQICSNDPSLAKQLLRRFGLSDQLLTAENSYHIGAAGQWAPAEWASLVDRYQRGEVDVIFNAVRDRLKQLAPPNQGPG